MAYNKKTWLARLGQGLNKFSIDGATPVPIISQPDSVTQQGDALSAGNLNDLEQRIADAFDDVEESKADKSTTDALQSQINQHESRIENLEQKAGDYTTVQYRGTNAVPTGKAKNGLVEKIVGKTRAWNQLVQNGNFADTSNWGAGGAGLTSFTASSNNGHLVTNGNGYIYQSISVVTGHKYLAFINLKGISGATYVFNGVVASATGTGSWMNVSAIREATSSSIVLMIETTANGTTDIGEIVVRDLTTIFPEGVPSTIAECVKKCPDLLKYDAYGTSLVDETLSGVKSVGVNIWDEETESGSYDEYGNETTNANKIRSVNYIPVKGGETYYFMTGVGDVFFYDANKTNIGHQFGAGGSSYTIPVGTCYIRFACTTAYGTTYNHDIQICLNSYADKTTYHPYKTDTLSLSETVTLRGVGSVAEVLDVGTGEVTPILGDIDLGTLDYVEVAMSGNRTGYAVHNFTTNYDVKCSASRLSNAICAMFPQQYMDKDSWGSNVFIFFPEPSSIFTLYDLGFITDAGTYSSASDFKNKMIGKHIIFEKNTVSSTFIDPILDNFIEVEGGGTINTIQEQTPVIDNCLDVGYLTV